MTNIKSRLVCIIMILFFNQLYTQSTAEDYINIIDSTSDKDIKFNALDSLIFSLKWDEDPNKYADYTDVYIDLAIEKKKYKDAIDAATYVFSSINNQLGNPQRALEMLNKVEVYKDKTTNTKTVGNIYLKKGAAYFNGKNFSKAIENYSKSIDVFTEKDSIYEADAWLFLGQAQFSSGNYLEAINSYNLAYDYYEKLEDQQYMFYAKANIIDTYGINGFHKKTIEERSKLISKKKALNYNYGLIVDYHNQAINYGKIGNIKDQEASLLNALKYLDIDKNLPNPEGQFVFVHSSLVSFYADQNNLEKAKYYLDQGEQKIKLFKEITLYELRFNYAKAKYLFLTGDLNSSEKLILNSLQQVEEWGMASLFIKYNDLLYQIYLKNENFNKALNFFKAKTKIQDSIFSKEKTNAFSYYQTLYETERQEKEIATQEANIKILEQEKDLEVARTRVLIIALAAIVSITLIIVYVLRQRALQLKQKIKFHKKELTTYTNDLLKKSREHDILEEELIVLKEVKLVDDKLDKLQDLVSSKILTSDDWKEFKIKFEKVYPNFLVKARLNHNLTNAEERLLTLEKLNLKTSEIADVLGVSSESVIKNRYRLRKKLGLSKNVPITEIAEN